VVPVPLMHAVADAVSAKISNAEVSDLMRTVFGRG
jgi:hypothetical protein